MLRQAQHERGDMIYFFLSARPELVKPHLQSFPMGAPNKSVSDIGVK